MGIGLSKLWEINKDGEAWHAAAHVMAKNRHNWVTEQQQQQEDSAGKNKATAKEVVWFERRSPAWLVGTGT